MGKYFKVTKLNLSLNSLKDGNLDLGFMSMLGIDKDALKDVPDEESVWLNSDKIIGISQKMKTGIKDDERLCHKVYFSPNDFWAIKSDDDLLKMLEEM